MATSFPARCEMVCTPQSWPWVTTNLVEVPPSPTRLQEDGWSRLYKDPKKGSLVCNVTPMVPLGTNEAQSALKFINRFCLF